MNRFSKILTVVAICLGCLFFCIACFVGVFIIGLSTGSEPLMRFLYRPAVTPDAEVGCIGIKVDSFKKTGTGSYRLKARVINVAFGPDSEIYAQGYFHLEDKNRQHISEPKWFATGKTSNDGVEQDYLMPGESDDFDEEFFAVTGRPAYVVYEDNTEVYADEPIRVRLSL